MVEIWFAILVLTLILFTILDGWNIGAGALHLVVARTDPERRGVIAALGPLWSWNEVWLLAAGGVFILAFPPIMAAALAGFYLAIWLVLWSLLLRGMAIEIGGHVADPLWRAGWDVVLAGDVFYDRTMADLVWPWLASLARRGALVLVGDPGRAYCPRDGMDLLATNMVPVSRALEDSEIKRTSVWQVTG